MKYLIIVLVMTANAYAQAPAAKDGEFIPQDHRPGLFFKEDFKAPPQGIQSLPINQMFIQNSNLTLKTYGPGKELINVSHHWDAPKSDPVFIFTGLTPASWALLLSEKTSYVDLTGLAKIRWRIEETGFHELRPVIKLADGTFLIGDYAESWTPDWHEGEFWPAFVHWRLFSPDNALELRAGGRFENGAWVEHPDLSKVDEVGFTDLMAGSGHGQGGWSRIDWIEVYGNPVKRPATPPRQSISARE